MGFARLELNLKEFPPEFDSKYDVININFPMVIQISLF
jgi:hypothetical protein